MRPIEHYEALLYARRQLVDWVRAITPEQFAREFEFGHRSIRATLAHLVGAEWLYGKAVRGEEIDRARMPFTAGTPPDLARLEKEWEQLEPSTRAWLESDEAFTRPRERTTTSPDGKHLRIGYTPEKVAFQMFYHEVHHRSQVMAMLRLMGRPVGNLDFSRYAYEWTELP